MSETEKIKSWVIKILEGLQEDEELSSKEAFGVVCTIYVVMMQIMFMNGMPNQLFIGLHEEIKNKVMENRDLNALAMIVMKMMSGVKDDD